jgi:hypothetical protein
MTDVRIIATERDFKLILDKFLSSARMDCSDWKTLNYRRRRQLLDMAINLLTGLGILVDRDFTYLVEKNADLNPWNPIDT